MAKGKGKGKGHHETTGSSTSESLTTGSLTSESFTFGSITSESSTSESFTSGRRRRCTGDVVNLRFNPATDAVLSAFVAGSILPCTVPPVGASAAAFNSCLEANGFEIQGIEALTPTEVLLTLVRC